ncbi:MAG: hypothetical protein NWE93_14590 [Candidatus Bathyarchaeota archaeon]|nr:hypothetical protein [Candidatus Bathyarchaeota archaeon]
MNRTEAVNLIREINDECQDIRGTSIMLMEPTKKNPLSKGYQVHLVMKATPQRLKCLQIVAEQYGCKVHVSEDKWTVIVYRPMKTPQAINAASPA